MIFKFKKAGVWTNAVIYKRRVAGVWQYITTGQFKSGATWPYYWDTASIKIQAPPEGTYAGAAGQVLFPSTAGADAYLVRSASTSSGAVSVTLGPWKKPASTFISGDTVQVYVDAVSGDTEMAPNSATDTWLTLYPGSTIRKWYAEDSTATRRALFKVTLKDQNDNLVTWWADCSDTGPTVITHTEPAGGGGGGGGGGGSGGEGPPDSPF